MAISAAFKESILPYCCIMDAMTSIEASGGEFSPVGPTHAAYPTNLSKAILPQRAHQSLPPQL